MISKLLKWLMSHKLILFLLILAFVVIGYPIFIIGVANSAVYHVDPDMVYITNAILYTKAKIIVYTDHPGTPTIMLIYYLFFPLRLISKYLLHQSFIQWSFDNYSFLTQYVRICMLSIVTIGLGIFLNLIKKITNSKAMVILTFLLTFLFTGVAMGSLVVPESTSFFLTVCWLVVFAKFLKSRKYFWVAVLTIIAGITLANKFTGLFLGVASIFLPLLVERTKFGQKIVMIEANVTIYLQSFLFGIWAVRERLLSILGWGNLLYSHVGTHATGAGAPFDLGLYGQSIMTLIDQNRFAIIFVGLTVVLAVSLVLRKRVKATDPVIFLTLIAFLGFLVFAKYPLIHYEFLNLTLLVFCLVYLLTKVKFVFTQVLTLILVILFVSVIRSQIISNQKLLNQLSKENTYATLNSWTAGWSSDVYRDELNFKGFTKP